jgi:hypothetical protein
MPGTLTGLLPLASTVQAKGTRPAHALRPGLYGCFYGFLEFRSYCKYELAVVRRGVKRSHLFASDLEKHCDVAIGFGARCRNEVHARRCQPRVRGVEALTWTTH